MQSGDDRTARLRAAVMTQYQASAPATAIEADLAVLTALIPRRTKQRSLFALIGIGSLFGLPIIGISQSNASVGGGLPFVFGLMFGIIIFVVMFAIRRRPIVFRDDKLPMVRALLRRIDFAPGHPVNVRANLGAKPLLVKQDFFAAGARAASFVKVFQDEWLALEGRLSNGIGVQLWHSTLFGREETAHTQFDTPTTTTETVVLGYPPQMNSALASYGPTIAQHLQLPGAKVEEIRNEPGALMVRISFEGPNVNKPEPLAALLAQVVALVDRSQAFVQVDRDAWPPYVPTASEVAAARV